MHHLSIALSLTVLSTTALSSSIAFVDDNNNGISDDIDIMNNPELDCNMDGILDLAQNYDLLQTIQQPTSLPLSQIGDRFGDSVDSDGSSLAIGSSNDPTYESSLGNFEVTGAVYVYSQANEDSPWVLKGNRIVPPIEPGESPVDSLFGLSVSVDGNRVLVGAPDYITTDGNTGAAFVYIFDEALSDWVLEKILRPGNDRADDFGASVAISGNRILVGDPKDDPIPYSASSNYGSFNYYVWDSVTEDWELFQKTHLDTLPLVENDEVSNDEFGTAVAFVGDAIVVSAPKQDFEGRANGGAVYSFYENSTGTILLPATQPLTGTERASFLDPTEFGESLSGDGDFLAIGSPKYKTNNTEYDSGRVYVYELDSTSSTVPAWIVDHDFRAGDGEAGDLFGSAVDIEHNIIGEVSLAVSAIEDSNSTGIDNGAVYIYHRVSAGVWEELNKMLPPEDSPGKTGFGISVANRLGDTFIGVVDDESTADETDGDLQGVYVFGPIPSCGGCNAADLAADGALNFLDVSAFLSAYTNQDPRADLAEPFGSFNFLDVSEFLSLFSAGCP